MNDTTLPLDPEEALVDIRTLVRAALQSDEIIAVQQDLEMILTIVEMALTRRQE
jgi:hypothetical protein